MVSENGQEKRETRADIVAEIRAYGAQPPPRLMWLEIADRIEAAARREKAEWEAAACACVSDAVMSGRVAVEHKPVGNAAAMYDALVKIAHYCDDKDGMDDPYCADWHILSDIARAALSKPPRNCDKGTPDEQGVRCLATMRHWRKAYQGDALITAIMKWAQEPYTEKGENND